MFLEYFMTENAVYIVNTIFASVYCFTESGEFSFGYDYSNWRVFSWNIVIMTLIMYMRNKLTAEFPTEIASNAENASI